MKNHILYLVCLANETGRTNLVWLGTGTDWLRSSSSYGLQKESAVTCAMQQMDSLHPIYMQAPKPLEALAAHLPSGSRLWCPADGSSSHLALAVRGAVVPPRRRRPVRSGAFGAAAVRGAYPRLGTPWPLPRHSCIFISTQSSAVLSFYGNCVLGPTLKILTVPTASCPPALYAEFCCVSHSLPRTPTNPSPPLPSTIIV